MKLIDILTEDKIILNFEEKTKDEIINKMIELFKDDDRVIDLQKVKDAVFEREKIMSTGVGKGFAVPHAKTDAVKEMLVALAKTDNPIDFESLDGNPVDLIFMLIGREDMVGEHIKILSRISRMMNNDSFREKLKVSETKKDIIEVIKEEETKFFDI